MKYTIHGFSQAFAITLKQTVTENGKAKQIKIDCTDLLILRWFVDFFPRMKKMYIDGEQYAFVTHGMIIKDLPLLDITKRACIERMKKLVRFDILKYHLLKQGGTYSLYAFGNNYENLIKSKTQELESGDVQSTDTGEYIQTAEGHTFEQHRGIRSTDIGVYVQPTNKNSSTNTSTNYSTNYNNMPDKSGESVTANATLIASNDTLSIANSTSIASIKDEFEKLWEIYPNKQGKQHAYKAYEKARKRKQDPVTYEQVKAGIEKYCEYIAAKGISKQYIKHGSTYFNGAEWESEYDLTPVQQYQPQTYQKPQTETKKWATAEGDHEPPEVIMGFMTIQEFAEKHPRSFVSYYSYYEDESWCKEWAEKNRQTLEEEWAKYGKQ